MVYKFFDKKSASLVDKYASRGAIKNENMSNKELAEEVNKPIIGKCKLKKVYSPFKYNIWNANLADMQLMSKCNKGNRFLLCAIDILVNMHGLFL